MPDYKEKLTLATAATITVLLKRLPSPAHAANALSIAKAQLIVDAGAETEPDARAMADEMNIAVIDQWAKLRTESN